jgi:YggT family protein
LTLKQIFRVDAASAAANRYIRLTDKDDPCIVGNDYRRGSQMDILVQTLTTFLSIYTILLIVRILLSWFPNVDWFSPPFSVLSQLTDPYLNLFRSIIPPLGGIDLSPILAFLLLSFVRQGLVAIAVATSSSYAYF